MGQIRTARPIDLNSFPGSTFSVDDTPPIAQCQETQIAAPTVSTTVGLYTITKAAAFAGINLAGKKVTVSGSLADDGTYNIISNTDDVLITDHAFQTTESTATATCHDDGQAYLTRDSNSFARYAESQSAAYTFANRRLYTDIADPPMNDACTDTWSPA